VLFRSSDEVEVSCYWGLVDANDELVEPRRVLMSDEGPNGEDGDGHRQRFAAVVDCEEPGDYGVTIRIRPRFAPDPDLATAPLAVWTAPNTLPLG